MNWSKHLIIILLLGSTPMSAAAERALYRAEASPLSPPPGQSTIGDSHGDIAVAANGIIFLSVQGGEKPGVQVYGADRRYLRNLPGAASDYHGFRIHQDADGQEYLYAIEMNGERLLKWTLDGEIIFSIRVDAAVPDTLQDRRFLRKGVRLTGVAVASNGMIFVSDGYASSRIHVFDPEGTYLRSFAGKHAPYNFATAHKLIVDDRFDPERVLVTDRENNRLVSLDFDGNIVDIKSGFRRPSSLAIYNNELAVGELEGRVVVLDRDGRILDELGTNLNPQQIATPKVAPDDWNNRLLTAPHGVAYDPSGNLFVTEWNRWGRVLTFTRVDHGQKSPH